MFDDRFSPLPAASTVPVASGRGPHGVRQLDLFSLDNPLWSAERAAPTGEDVAPPPTDAAAHGSPPGPGLSPPGPVEAAQPLAVHAGESAPRKTGRPRAGARSVHQPERDRVHHGRIVELLDQVYSVNSVVIADVNKEYEAGHRAALANAGVALTGVILKLIDKEQQLRARLAIQD